MRVFRNASNLSCGSEDVAHQFYRSGSMGLQIFKCSRTTLTYPCFPVLTPNQAALVSALRPSPLARSRRPVVTGFLLDFTRTIFGLPQGWNGVLTTCYGGRICLGIFSFNFVASHQGVGSQPHIFCITSASYPAASNPLTPHPSSARPARDDEGAHTP